MREKHPFVLVEGCTREPRMRHLLIVVLIFASVSCSCKSVEPPVWEYGYVFHESTGLTDHVRSNGKEIAIQFRRNSDQKALRSLRALRWQKLNANADGHHMVLVGQLYTNVQRTPGKPDMAASEPYQEFSLRRWQFKRTR